MELIDLAGRGELVCRPNGDAYAHLAVEVFEALVLARQQGRAACFVSPRSIANEALLAIECAEVPVRHARGMRAALLGARLDLVAARRRVQRASARWSDHTRGELARELQRQLALRDLAPPVKERVRHWRDRLGAAADASEDGAALYYRRRLLRDALRIRLQPEVEAEAARLAREVGLDPDRPIVSVHAREGGYKRGREIQDRKPGKRDDSQRNARIDTYFAAMDHLIGQGYQVVRVGDASMVPVRREGVLDLATHPRRTDALDIWVLLRSRFLVSGESGPLGVSFLTDTPCLVVNATDPISTFPIRRSGMYILKHVIDLDTGRTLKGPELLTEPYYRNLRNTARFAYRDNSPGELVEAVREMDIDLRDGWSETPAQTRFRELVTEAALSLRSRVRYVAKWGIDDGFLGDGRVARFFADAALTGQLSAIGDQRAAVDADG